MNFQLKTIFVFLVVCFMSTAIYSQVKFTKVDNFIEEGNKTFVSVVTADMNNDNVDDVIHFDKGNTVVVHLNNRLGRDWQMVEGPYVASNAWSAIVVDLNNDGFKEIVFGAAYSSIPIYTFNYETNTFSAYQDIPNSFFIQNMNAVDINKDGFADLFMCNDLGENYFYINNNGVLELQELIDFSTDPEEHAAGNYASQFLDIDMDGDQDLYISKCSAFAINDEDPRLINQLFINDGNGNFEEMGEEFGINSNSQSWTSDFADLDLDGDLDLIIANHMKPLQLFRNQNNEYFEELTDLGGLNPFAVFYQLMLVDVDNDGLEDVVITEDGVEVYLNKGNFIFEHMPGNVLPSVSSSFSIGDFNLDGAIDIVAKAGGFNGENAADIYLQKQFPNNWINFRLEGTTDTKDAIGSHMELYYEGGVQRRYLRYGRSYGVQFSSQLHFGLGQAQSIDSVRVHWLNGDVETFSELELNENYFVRQNTCINKLQTTEIIQDTKCISEELILSHAGEDFLSWSTGSIDAELISGEEGTYYANYGNEDCLLSSWKAHVEFEEELDVTEVRPLLDQVGLLPCEGQEIVLVVDDETAIWNGSFVGSTYSSVGIDDISVVYTDDCKNYTVTYERTDVVDLFVAPEDAYQYDDGEDVVIDVANPSALWFDDISEAPFHEGESYLFQNVQDDRKVFIQNILTYAYEGQVGVEEIPDNAGQGSSQSDVDFNFTIIQPLELQSFTVGTNVAGIRQFDLFSECFVKIASVEQELAVGNNLVEWGIELDAGGYYVTTNEEVNIENFGGKGPLLLNHNPSGEGFPYSDKLGMISLERSSTGTSKYYNYYDWRVGSLESKNCDGSYYETELKSVVSVEDELKGELKYNTIVRGELNLEWEGNHTFRLFDSRGVLLASEGFRGRFTYVMSGYSAGVYYLECEGRVYKIVKV